MQILRHNVGTITLIRHGPPAVSLRQRVRGHQFRQFVARYDAAKIERQAQPPRAAKQVMSQADWVFASNRPRAMHTAELLGVPKSPVVDERFREIEFPVDFPRHFRFSALTWTVIALTLWRLGYSAQCEPLARARARARAAADMLEQQIDNPQPIASQSMTGQSATDDQSGGSVELVAHGGINRLIAIELRRRGWQGPRLPRSQHWGCTTYCR